MLPIINERIRYTKSSKKYISNIKKEHPPFTGLKWSSGQKKMKKLKIQIRTQLMHLQNGKCAFCGLKLGETSNPEIEHIAPKGGKKGNMYPQFMFTRHNLVLACHLCNSQAKKGSKDTIDYLDINYMNCSFNIYHPHLDNPEDHFDWVTQGFGIIIQPKSDLGRASIDTFKLSSMAHTNARMKQELYERLTQGPERIDELVACITEYKSVD